MRKKNGFMMMETLIVSVFVGITLVVLFIQLQNVSTSYTRTFTYNTANNLYNARIIKQYLASRNFDKFIADVHSTVRGYTDITSCANENYILSGEDAATAKAYCEMLYKNLNIKQILLTFEDLTDVKHILSKHAEKDNIGQKMVDFVDYIKYDKNPDKYRIIIEFKDETFASIQLSPTAFANVVNVVLNGSVPSNRWTTASSVTLTTKIVPEVVIGNTTYSWQKKVGSGSWTAATECGSSPTCTASTEGIVTYRSVAKNDIMGDAYSNQYVVKIDTTPPTCSFTYAGTKGANDWYTSDVKLSLNTTDAQGIGAYGLTKENKVSYNGTTSVTQGETNGTTYYGYAKDKAGNTNHCSTNLKIDKTAPKPTVSNPTGGNWTKQDFSLGLTAVETGSGVAYWAYSYDNSSFTQYGSSASTSFTTTPFSAERNQTAYLKVVDQAGNTATANTMIRIDKTAPKPTISNPTGGNWTNQSFSLGLNAVENGSGVASWAYSYDNVNFTPYASSASSAFTTTPFGTERNQAAYIKVTDKVGNTATASTMIRIDKTPPVISRDSSPGCGAYYPGTSNWYPAYRGYSMSDDASGLGTYSLSVKETGSNQANYHGENSPFSGTFSGSYSGGPLTSGEGVWWRNKAGGWYSWKICDRAGNCTTQEHNETSGC